MAKTALTAELSESCYSMFSQLVLVPQHVPANECVYARIPFLRPCPPTHDAIEATATSSSASVSQFPRPLDDRRRRRRRRGNNLLVLLLLFQQQTEGGIELGNSPESTKTGWEDCCSFPFPLFHLLFPSALDVFPERKMGLYCLPHFKKKLSLGDPPSFPKGFFRRCFLLSPLPSTSLAVNHAERFDEFSGATFGRSFSPFLPPTFFLLPSLMYANLCKEIRNGTVN